MRKVGVEDEGVEAWGVEGQSQDLREGLVLYEKIIAGRLMRLVRALSRGGS